MKMEHFVKKIVNDFQPLNIYVKSSILDVWLCSKYDSTKHLILTLFRMEGGGKKASPAKS